MRARHPLRASLVAALCLAAVLIASCGTSISSNSSSNAPIQVGAAVGRTGYLAAVDSPLASGIQLAANYVNSQGGVDGHKLDVHVIDMASVASTGVTATNQLLNQYNADVIMTGSSSAGTAAEAPIAERRQVPMIVETVLPPNPRWVFSALPLVNNFVSAELGYASKSLHASTVGFIYSQTPYGQQASQIAQQTAAQYGIKLAVNAGVDATATDVSPLLSRIRDAGAQAILSILTGPIQLVVAKNSASLGLNMPLIMGADDPGTLQSASASYANSYLLASAPQAYPDVPIASRKAAVKAFRDQWAKQGQGLTGIVGATEGWDEVQLLVAAVKASHATKGPALRDALEKASLVGTTTDYHYSSGDHTGQQKVANPFAIGQYHGTTLKLVAPFPTSPAG
ncbi:MAG: ABC transporter substrate-binding protein [Candidatus Dormibacteraeota bacterium]|nr:ABC transporter substrate-binding protein [Candidatus Dormibacteraeota bacterium]MBO0762862.1 ABC transporter substrate-binding protein [Candidatus Dormibacteraeota bacterium]